LIAIASDGIVRAWQANDATPKTKQKGNEMSNATFTGSNYSIETTEDGQFVLIHPTSENETFDSFEELVESHPICEEARSCFFDC